MIKCFYGKNFVMSNPTYNWFPFRVCWEEKQPIPFQNRFPQSSLKRHSGQHFHLSLETEVHFYPLGEGELYILRNTHSRFKRPTAKGFKQLGTTREREEAHRVSATASLDQIQSQLGPIIFLCNLQRGSPSILLDEKFCYLPSLWLYPAYKAA